jgi:hypothetical protein
MGLHDECVYFRNNRTAQDAESPQGQQGYGMMKPTPIVLLVPLVMASFGFPAMAPQQPSVWRQSQKTDASGGTSYTRFTLAGKFVKSPEGDVQNRPTFVLDCVPSEESYRHKSRLLAGNLVVGTALKIVYVEPEEIHGTSYFQKVRVLYRLDSAKEELERWSPGTDKTSASIPEDALKKILRAHTVELTLDDDHGLPFVIQFDMPDPTPVETGCGIDNHK